jgi:hypothetical protein
MLPKSTTWMGLFHQAIHWHDQIQKQEIITRLKKNYAEAVWQPLIVEKKTQFADWSFEELADLDRIIEESKRCHHCLAVSYAQRIMDGEYVAFHMASKTGTHHMTLGCHLREGQLLYDQLEYPHNQKAEYLFVNVALQFISWLNLQLIAFK